MPLLHAKELLLLKKNRSRGKKSGCHLTPYLKWGQYDLSHDLGGPVSGESKQPQHQRARESLTPPMSQLPDVAAFPPYRGESMSVLSHESLSAVREPEDEADGAP